VLRYLLARNDPNFMLNKVIEVEAPDRFSTRGVPAPFFPLRKHRCAGNSWPKVSVFP
jgi:hypothetical protein